MVVFEASVDECYSLKLGSEFEFEVSSYEVKNGGCVAVFFCYFCVWCDFWKECDCVGV